MGWRPAIWRRLMAFPDTSSMQCLPWMTQIMKWALSPLSPPCAITWTLSPCQPLLLPTVCWFHTDDCCTVQLLWIYAPGSLLPWPLWRKQSGNLGRPPRSLDVAVLCLGYNRSYMTGCGKLFVKVGIIKSVCSVSNWMCRIPSEVTVAFERNTHVGRRSQTCQGTQRWGHRWLDLSLVRAQWQVLCN